MNLKTRNHKHFPQNQLIKNFAIEGILVTTCSSLHLFHKFLMVKLELLQSIHCFTDFITRSRGLLEGTHLAALLGDLSGESVDLVLESGEVEGIGSHLSNLNGI